MGRRQPDWQHKQVIRNPAKPLSIPNKKKQDTDKLQCEACGACIGFEYMETMPYSIGKYNICGWCYLRMKERGRIQLATREAGRESQVTYLYPDGTTVKVKIGGKVKCSG